jgi:S-adenosylmethionine uptake transporter
MPAIVLALGAVFMGCVVDAFVKHLGQSYGAILIACCRYGFGSIFALTAFAMAKRPWPTGRVLRIHGVRAIAAVTSAVLFFHALSILQLAEATVLIFCAPLLIAPLARLILGETFRPMALAAIAVGFAGVLVTIQGAPADAGPRHVEGVASGLGAAALYSLSLVLLRQISKGGHAATTALTGNVFPFLILIIPAIALGQAPRWADVPQLAGLGLVGFLLWYLLSRAYAQAQAQTLAITEYSALIWSAALGFVFFHETPSWQVWTGAAVICGAILLSAWDSGRTRKRPIADSSVLPG